MDRDRILTTFVAMVLCCTFANSSIAIEPKKNSAVLELFEDEAEDLLKKLTNPTGDPGVGTVEKTEVFSGSKSIRIEPMQRFSPQIEGWNYRITKEPKEGEYRYLRFAWKAKGSSGIMVQLHEEKDWVIRYTAGIDMYQWGTKFVAEKPSKEWSVITRDLYEDYGERRLTGIALTVFDGEAGFFDHIYLGRSIEDLDRIDATGFRNLKNPQLSQEKLDQLWQDLSDNSASKRYQAFWRFVNGSNQSLPYLKAKLTSYPATASKIQITQWISDLDDNRFRFREAAARNLKIHMEIAAPFLRDALKGKVSAESRTRIEGLLEFQQTIANDGERIEKSFRIFEYCKDENRTALVKEIVANSKNLRVLENAKLTLKRLEPTK